MTLFFKMGAVRTFAALVLFVSGFSMPPAAFAFQQSVDQSNQPIITYDSQHHPVLARNGMVVAQDKLAAEAGRQVLMLGGNAVDAAVATGFALAVTHPQAGNLGGGGFMVVYLADEERSVAIDYREMAPSAATRDMFLDATGAVDNRLARFSMKSSGVPGTVMGLTEAHRKYGKLPLADVMAPAIKLAENGFEMTWALYDSLGRYEARLKANPVSAQLFFKADGNRYEPGELFRQSELAETLKLIAEKGSSGFYEGQVADAIVRSVTEGGGLITHEDLRNYVAKEREAIRGTYRGYEVVAMPPASSGGVHVVQMLNVLEGYNLRSFGHNSAQYIHVLTETMKYAYADRSKYLGDMDFFPVPIEQLTAKSYAETIRSRIDLSQATPSSQISPAPDLIDESPDTTHFSVMDAAGNMVSNTTTLNFTYGNGSSVAGAGFLLNNEMDDFSSKPGVPNAYGLLGGEANAIEPGKRPLSAMTPVILLKDGKPVMATGSPGGSRIITTVLQMILNVVDFGMNPAAATAAPRLHHQWYPDHLMLEPGFSVDTRRLLRTMGHNVAAGTDKTFDRVMGSAQTVMKAPNGLIMGAADTRRPGAAAAGY